ncbi:MAG: MMPL family transporter, partial [Verrucomicrobiota bacterium]
WAAATTALVFSALNLSAIPGIAQLGTLVSVGLVIGAAVSLTFFHQLIARKQLREPRTMKSLAVPGTWAIGTAFVILSVGIYALVSRGLPALDTRPETMLPSYSETAVQYENLRRELGSDGAEPIAVLFRAETEESVREAMHSWEEKVSHLNGVKAAIPHALWPRPDQDFSAVQQLVSAWPMVQRKLDENFGETALDFAQNAFDVWGAKAEGRAPDFSDLADAGWILSQAVRIEPGELPTAKGLVSTTTGAWLDPTRQQLLELADSDPRITLLGWDNLGPTLERLYQHDSRLVVIPSIVVLFIVLFLVFRSFRAVFLSVLTLGLSCIMLLALMRGLGIAWNQINLMAIPLLLGAGLDYNIHIQLALRRSGGNLETVGQTTGKALLVCGLSTAAGFASLGWSHHPGLASLGQTCALGIVCTMFVAVMLLPGWWCTLVKQNCAKVS